MAKIPSPIDYGKHCESTVDFLWYHWQKHISLLQSGVNLLTDTADRYACGLPIPNFQRQLCWSPEQEKAFIESIWLELPLGTYSIHEMDWGNDGGAKAKHFSGWVIDGQQRLTTIQRYWEDKFKVYGSLYSELTPRERRRFLNTKFVHYESSLWNEAAIKDLYNRMAFGGVAHQPNEFAT